MDLSKYQISSAATISEALTGINDLSGDAQVLFVVNSDRQVVATLSDGDIRRGLIAGHSISDKVETIMFRDFHYLIVGQHNVGQLLILKKQNISVIPILDAERRLCKIINLKTQQSLLPIDAVIMAGGKGERLRPLTENTPKPLLKVGNKSIIDHNVDRLISYGVEYISVTVNYLKEQLEEHYKNGHNGVQVHCIREPKFLGTMGAVRLVTEFHNDVVLVMNSDLFTEIDFEDFYLHFINNSADMSVAAIPYNVSIPLGIFELEGRNIKSVLEKPIYNYYANAGVYLIKKSVLDYIPVNERFDATDLINKLIALNKSVIRYPLNGTWIDIGTIDEYKKAQDLARHIKAK